MKRLHCPTCSNEVYFDSLECVRCLTKLVFEFDRSAASNVRDVSRSTPCANRWTWGCNWRSSPAGDGVARCASCQLVDTGGWDHDVRMAVFQTAQRRALYQLTQLGLPWGADADAPLRFTYRSGTYVDALIGHQGGEITLDLDEADPARREEIRARLGERYRTPLGHVRHELGHYIWLTHVARDPDRLADFRQLFGLETTDYAEALAVHYAGVDNGNWHHEYASFYASSHPWEDFAESWAQVMHVHDVVETGAAWGIVTAPADAGDAMAWLATSTAATLAANELARAMGAQDLYPFALSTTAQRKVGFCWSLVRAR